MAAPLKKSLKKQNIPSPDYQKLLTLIRREIDQAVVTAKKEIEYQAMVGYWKIGRHITAHLLTPGVSAQYGSGLMPRLSRDLKIPVERLHKIVRFYKCYPVQPKTRDLTWTHYQALIRVPDAGRRRVLEQKVVSQKISSMTLKQMVTDLNAAQKMTRPNPDRARLPVQRGVPYVYRIRSTDTVHAKGPSGQKSFEVDCGFDISIAPPESIRIKLQSGKIVRSRKDQGVYTFVDAIAQKDCLYTYVAYIEKVVDADTLDVKIDGGFGLWVRHRLRLRGINAPEMSTVKGQKAKDWVKKTFQKIPFVIIRTYGAGKYGRYVTDVFYLKATDDPYRVASEGRLLNQDLIDQGLAEVY